MPTRDTTPVWAHTDSAEQPEVPNETYDTADEAEAMPARPMTKGDPIWSKTQTPTVDESKPKTAVPMQKTSPEWAQTVPTQPGAEEAPVEPTPMTKPLKAAASDAAQHTWPPAEENTTAPPAETDVWPPEPPTESMSAWPPSSEISEPTPTPEKAMPAWSSAREDDSKAGTAPPAASTEPVTPAPPPAPPPPPTVPVSGVEASPPPQPTQPPQEPASPQPSAPPWAPAAPARPVTAQNPNVDWPGAFEIPAWAPQIPVGPQPRRPRTGPQPAVTQPVSQPPVQPTPPQTWQPVAQPLPTPPAPARAQPAPTPQAAPAPPAPTTGQLPVAQVPVVEPTPVKAPAAAGWEIVDQKRKDSGPHAATSGPTPEDRSYAEWFAWAKRGGAPASACHAAAQGAFEALSAGNDLATAVQMATAAMSRPPAQVSAGRQAYCAWFALGNIDLNIEQSRAHAFAAAATHALDSGQDARAAHAAGLAAAGIK